MPNVIFVVGTMPEIIKSVDVARRLASSGLRVTIYDTLQNREDAFDVPANVEIKRTRVVRAECHDDMAWVASCASDIAAMAGDMVVVQGDTYSALAGAHGAVSAGARLVHIEAGLRSRDPLSPFPEEMIRTFIDTQSEILFCATPTDFEDLGETANLAAKETFVVGNTVCDPIFRHRERLALASAQPSGVLVSLHRRENRQHQALILEALARLVQSFPATHFRMLKRGLLAQTDAGRFGPNATMVDLSEHLRFLEMLAGSQVAVCDSGGILEEAVTLGVPLICLRRTLERGRFVEGVECLDPADMAGPRLPALMNRFLSARGNNRGPLRETFGDGRSAERIATALFSHVRGPLVERGQSATAADRAHAAVLVPFERPKTVERPNATSEPALKDEPRRYATAGGDRCEP